MNYAACGRLHRIILECPQTTGELQTMMNMSRIDVLESLQWLKTQGLLYESTIVERGNNKIILWAANPLKTPEHP
jgi:predicted transcriptional regulator